ncbi:MAG: regulatory protein RecX [Blastocatellia bacterium]
MDQVYEKTLARAFRLLAAKPRTIAELRERLGEKPWTDAAAIERVIARLLELGYLNDEDFAAGYTRAKLSAKPLGPRRLRQDLQRKKVDAETAGQAIENAYEGNREEELIDRALARRLRLKGKPQSREEAGKLLDHLLRLGFSYDLAMRKVREAGKIEEPEID